MSYLTQLFNDIFLMKFDIIMPVSGCIVAFLIAAILFSIRYVSFKRKKRKFEKLEAEQQDQVKDVES